MKYLAVALCALLPCLAAGPEIDKGKILGSPVAPVRIEVFSDFECPACKSFHEGMLPLIVQEFVIPGKVAVISHEFPLSIAAHKYSREAANYATAAARLGIYQPVADALFKNQQSWMYSGKLWETVASVLSPEQQKRVQALLKDPSVAAEVQHDVEAGTKAAISSTPTIIISHGANHFPLPWPVNYNFLRSLINGYLK